MKKFIWRFALKIIFAINLISFSFAQDYKLFNSGQDHFFYSGSNPFFNQYYNSNADSWSQIKETRFDSILSSANDTLYFPFRTWRDTVDSILPNQLCGYKNGPSWMGLSIHEIYGTTWLFDFDGDSIRIEHAAALNQSWVMMSLDSSGHLLAMVDSLFLTTFASITDSVKQIRFTALDSNGIIRTSHALNNKTIWLSKSNGLFRGLSFRDLPEYAELKRIEPIPMPTYGDLYDYDVGDEFEYIHTCHTNTGASFNLDRIVAKWFNSTMDSVFYAYDLFGLSIQQNSNPQYVYSHYTDTFSFTNLNVPIYAEVPEQNTKQHFYYGIKTFGIYTLTRDSSYCNNRPVYEEFHGFCSTSDTDSCVVFNNFEHTIYYAEAIPGIGVTWLFDDNTFQGGTFCESRLVWYKKGNETFGNFVQVTAGIDELKNTNIFQVYPNPATDQCMIFTDPKTFSELEIFSISGQKISELKIVERITSVDLSEFSPGIYFLKAKGPGGIVTRKIIKQ